MRLSDHLGTITTDVSHLHKFVKAWFDPNDRVVLVGIPLDGSRKVLSMQTTAKDLSEITAEELTQMSFIKETGVRMSMYVGINPVKEENKITLRSRGTKDDIQRIIGLFVDLDVKRGAFASKSDIHKFLDTLPLKPTIVIDNGENGGIHAYWKVVREDQSLVIIDNDVRKGWWAYLQKRLGDEVKIDKLTDSTRISRLPSGIYWPKDGTSKSDIVRVHTLNPENVYTSDQLQDVIGDSIREYQLEMAAKRKSSEWFSMVDVRAVENQGGDVSYPDYFAPAYRRNSEQMIKERTKALSDRLESYGIDLTVEQVFLKMSVIENLYNDRSDWDEILKPHGWTYLKTQDDGSRVFARPGRDERSAVVDYVSPDGEKSHVMSLLSSSPETNLSDLKEAGVPLTKYRVALRLNFDDDEIKMLAAHMGKDRG